MLRFLLQFRSSAPLWQRCLDKVPLLPMAGAVCVRFNLLHFPSSAARGMPRAVQEKMSLMCGLTRENAAFELALTLPRVDRVKWTITTAGAHLELIIFEATKSKKVKKKGGGRRRRDPCLVAND